jgi:hypothetical protein
MTGTPTVRIPLRTESGQVVPRAFDGGEVFVACVAHELRASLAIQRALLEVALADPNRMWRAGEKPARTSLPRVGRKSGSSREDVLDAGFLPTTELRATIRPPVTLTGCLPCGDYRLAPVSCGICRQSPERDSGG